MRINNIHLKNFKRFSDLAIRDIPETSKLVLLIGANGSGKSDLAKTEWFKHKISTLLKQ